MYTPVNWAGREKKKKKKKKKKKRHPSFKCCKNYKMVFDWQGSSLTRSDKHPHPLTSTPPVGVSLLKFACFVHKTI